MSKWYHYVGYFFGGAFLANCIPHLVSGIMGQQFPTPFGMPFSPAIANVFWGFFNLAASYAILTAVGGISFTFKRQVAVAALGFLAMGAMLSTVAFGKMMLWG